MPQQLPIPIKQGHACPRRRCSCFQMGHKEELVFAGCLHHETQIGAFNEGLRDDSLVL